MSGAMFPSYNSGKVIGEINWLDFIYVETAKASSYATIYTPDMVIPVNRKDINEIFLGFVCGGGSSITTFTKNDIVNYVSSESNTDCLNILAFIRDAEIGSSLRISCNGYSLSTYQSFLTIVSETNDSVIVNFSLKYMSSNAYHANLGFRMGWR